jgi:uncharacterized membrane protein
MSTYILSSVIFAISSVIYLIGSVRTYILIGGTDNAISLVGGIFYVVAYLAYIYECKKDNSKPSPIPMITRPLLEVF